MIYLQATISEFGTAAVLLRLAENNEISLFVSHEIISEIRGVLSRTKIRGSNLDITDERVDALITRISESSRVIVDVPQHFAYSRDPKDEKYVNVAVEARADYIVSRDKDLLDLMTGYTDECKDFRRRFRPLKVVAPEEFLKTIEARST